MTPVTPVSVVIPVLNDTGAACRLLSQLRPHGQVEVIVVDGAHDPALDACAAGAVHIRILRSAPGRARQMNAGAAAASGTWLLFLHADSVLPDEWLAPFSSGTASIHGAIGGWYRFSLEDTAWQARVLEALVAWRVRLFRLPYGDQGLFVRRSSFEQLGGYRDMPFLEDVEFVRRLVRTGSVFEIDLPLRTSSRRWRRDGWWGRSARNLAIVLGYFSGVSVERLAGWYRARCAPRE